MSRGRRWGGEGGAEAGGVPELKDKRMHLFLKDEIMIAGYSEQYYFLFCFVLLCGINY